MFAASPIIQNTLKYDAKMAKDLLMFYMKNYEMIYHPENAL